MDQQDVEQELRFEEILAACQEYLSNRKVVLWSTTFEIQKKEGRTEAAKWLALQVAGVLGVMNKED